MSQDFSWQGYTSREDTEIGFFGSLISHVREYTKEAVEHLILLFTYYSVLCLLMYMGIVKWQTPQFKRDIENPKRVLIVIAHPDDECMFFGPTNLGLHYRRVPLYINEYSTKIYIASCTCALCLLTLVTRNNYGMGRIRKNELYRACTVLGIDTNNIIIKSHSSLPDSLKSRWPSEIVERIVLQHTEMYYIDTLITFDRNGVSRHPNHCSIYYAIASLSLEKKLPSGCTVYVLETVNVVRKYWLIFDIPLCYIFSRTRYLVSFSERLIIYQAMKEHKSQLVWFRWLYMCFSRYMLINTLQKMDLTDIELDLELED